MLKRAFFLRVCEIFLTQMRKNLLTKRKSYYRIYSLKKNTKQNAKNQGGKTMFTNQFKYWNEMTEMVHENYKTSLKAGQEFQEGFGGMLKDIMEANIKNTMELQKSFDNVTKKNVDMSMDLTKNILGLYTENMKKRPLCYE